MTLPIPATIENVLNEYLFGASVMPYDPQYRLRGPNPFPQDPHSTVLLDAVSFMAGVGRFAKLGDAKVVRDFFAGSLTRSGTTDAAGVTRVTIGELDLTDSETSFVISNYTADVGADDFASRAFIWGSSRYELSDSTTLVWDSNGNRSIVGGSIHPLRDNFDFDGSNSIIDSINNNVLRPLIDPYNIGARVDFLINPDSLSALDANNLNSVYDQTDFASYVTRPYVHASQSYLAAMLLTDLVDYAAAVQELANSIISTGSPDYTFYDRDVIYGTSGDDSLSYLSHQGVVISLVYVTGVDPFAYGAYFVAGTGNDRVEGGEHSDWLLGGEGDDVLMGFDGDDNLIGGDGDDVLIGGSGGGDYLDGGAGDDLLIGGSIYDNFYGGDGDDILLTAPGATGAIAYTGAGSDLLWVITQASTYIEAKDADSSDRLVWNGHLLTGGSTYVIDQELVGTNDQTWLGYADEFAVTYQEQLNTYYEEGLDPYDVLQLVINTPDGQTIVVDNYTPGAFGIQFTGMTPYEYQIAGSGDRYADLPRFSTANDGLVQAFNGALLSAEGAAAVATMGSVPMPDYLLI